MIAKSNKSNFIICSDSLSCLLAIQHSKFKNPFILKIIELYKALTTIGKEIIFLWVPSHVGIHGNTVVDQLAKDALADPYVKCSVPYTDFRPKIKKYIFNLKQEHWNTKIENKFYEIEPSVTTKFYSHSFSRRDQVILTRCRIGHSRVTHSYLLNGEDAPECIPCQCRFTLKHVLIDCIDFADIRNGFYSVATLKDLFNSVAGDFILKYLKEVNLYGKI